MEELKKKDEDDDYRQDSDPKGFELYEKSVSSIYCYDSFLAQRSNRKGFRDHCVSC